MGTRKAADMTDLSEAAAAMGRKGGRAKVKKGFAVLTEERSREIQAAGRAARKKKVVDTTIPKRKRGRPKKVE